MLCWGGRGPIGKAPESLKDVVESIEELGEEQRKVSLGDALDTFGRRSFYPMFILLPIIDISPIGGIPAVPTILAALIALVALQVAWGRKYVWLPAFIKDREVTGDKLVKATHKLDDTADWIDAHLGARLDWLIAEPWPRIAAVVIIMLCCTVPPLEIIPFASTVPMVAIALIGLALLVRDGLAMVVALTLSIGALSFAFVKFFGSTPPT
ncbi:exopolysaccharide biosynthesis protein [Altererythrobacter sp.]|nr:exopolysaccharide biosynthesis protein [Altererythrobacter sp.]